MTDKYTDAELSKMIRGFRVSDLQSLLRYFGRNSNGKKYELQSRSIDLLKIRCVPVDSKILEIQENKLNGIPNDPQDVYPVANDPIEDNDPTAISLGPGLVPYIPNNSKHVVLPPHVPPVPQYPVNPDVKMIDLPFYDVMSVLLKPTSLASPFDRYPERERKYIFYLTPQQTLDFSQGTPDVQVQARMCLSDSSSEQEDEIPADIIMRVNRAMFQLPHIIPTNKPGALPKRPRRPMDISLFTKKSATEPNEVAVSWTSPPTKPYALSIYLVRRQNSCELIRRLKANGVRNPDHTTAMIKEKLTQDRDSEIATMSLRGALTCPLGKIRMKLPCRALTCGHLQCFDATLYLQMNEKKPKWICPVCDKPALFKNLAIDGLFLDISFKAPAECSEVQFHEDGSWTPVMPIKKPPEVSDAFEAAPKVAPKVEADKPKRPIEVISLDSDSDTEEDTWSYVPPKKKKAFRPPPDSSPVLIDSPDSSEDSTEVITPADPEVSSTSKDSAEKIVISIPEKSTLPPLPPTLQIDAEEEGIVGSSGDAAGNSSFEDISPVESPESSTDAKKDDEKNVDVESASDDRSPENTSEPAVYSLCDEDILEDTVNSPLSPPEIQEVGSPDIIDLD